ncbi:Peptidyl-prolyl cis-trans isomerase FKBP14 [Oryzias melastigma]|uniref:peptidylprolyl isomerase n=1 Tax=Oryzias melastigma TaxID=30732 RepID=A0A3B3DRV2_ORYME|nr:peptidyl-prolyl cis-trans isomerase FKBP14 [Oryzias melastigma]KAF6716746.1 Peptidyl-prolyl cis-trans isomerase FKBP14 [Oryzias melastigma]KAF6737933.1 Peptidyl-prolyl cis-trans isomerase FKBP14 [Oryzias melastigma]
MLLSVWSWWCSSLLVSVSGAGAPEEEMKMEVLHKPFICRRKSKNGDLLLLHHEAYFENGTLLLSSRTIGDKQPVWFTLGIREGIKGWDLGLRDMCAGEQRKLVIPPSLAYGDEGKGKIPPKTTLTFKIELVEIRNGPRSHESFQEMDLNDDWRLSKHEVKEYLKKEFERYGHPPNDTLNEEMANDIFTREDKNKDGFISSREFTYKHDEL